MVQNKLWNPRELALARASRWSFLANRKPFKQANANCRV
jgi:hypothetical protein